jgi:two-component system NtrC family sensor kinase
MNKLRLFKTLNFSLTAEVIFNISILMISAILLIGFTLSKINEKSIVSEKVKNGEGIVQDFQAVIDFISRDKMDFSLTHPNYKKEIQDFVHIYSKERKLYNLIIVDQGMKVAASKEKEWLDKTYSSDLLKNAVQSGQFNSEIESSGGLLLKEYKTLILYSPLWFKGRIAGGILIGVPMRDVMVPLLESRRILFITIILDAIILIVFGSFLMSRVLVKPLKDLAQLTQKISQGDFSQKIEETSKNEIGQLIISFNRMLEKLKENKENLETYLESLELANKKLKQTQEELTRTEKLASIGRFAAGVAHEVGNPLGAILGYTSILQKEGIDQEESNDYLKRIEREIERINHIVRELLDFARPSTFEIQEVEVNKVIEDTLSLLSHQKIFKNIETQLTLQPVLPIINGNESQLSQVLINIVLNAVDAMPAGGVLRIQTDEYVVEDALIDRYQPHYPSRRREDPLEYNYASLRKPDPLVGILAKFSRGDRLVRIRISDTGIGIKKEDLERVFDPFFTTKAPDKGTGLGLSISLRIVESMGGKIKAESECGKGSTFELFFPELT